MAGSVVRWMILASLIAVAHQQDTGSRSKGLATSLNPVAGTGPCTNASVTVQPDVFPTRTGSVTSSDGKTWTVPAVVHEGAVRPTCAQKDPLTCEAMHFEVPSRWTSPQFDDSVAPGRHLATG